MAHSASAQTDVTRRKTTTKDAEPLASVGICRQTSPVTKTSQEPPEHCCSARSETVFDLPDRGRLRDVREVAALLKTTRDAVYDLISTGLLTATKPAGRYRVSIPDLEAYVRSTRVVAVLPVTQTNEPDTGATSPAPGGEDDE